MDSAKIKILEDQLGHTFEPTKKELIRALTHPTFSKEEKEKPVGARDCPNQETYATLGDAVLKAGIIVLLMERELKSKGDITMTKSEWENNLKLAEVGKRLRLLENNLILHRAGEGADLERASEAIRSDSVEALIGAIFIDTGYNFLETNSCISTIFAPEIQEMERKYHLGKGI